MSSFATKTVTRLRYPVSTKHGATLTDFTASPEEHPIEGCWIEPTPSANAGGARTATKTGYRIAMPHGTEVIAATDHVRLNGEEYECEGDAIQVESPTGALNQALLTVYQWKG